MALQVVISNYFANVGTDKDSPFILGYSISAKPKSSPPANAVFQPTSATYSTTFSNQTRASSFNFLMQTDSKDLPSDHRKKTLPGSLIEQVIDKSETINGVFGIDYSLFKSKYVDAQLIPELLNALSTNIKNSFPQHSINEDRSTDGITFWLSKEKEELKFLFQSLKIEPSKEDRKGIEVFLEWSADASLQQVKEISNFRVVVTQTFSSKFGIFGNEGKPAKNGKLGVLLSSGTHGELVLNPIIDTPILGKKTPGPQISGIPEFAQQSDIFKNVLAAFILLFLKDAVFMDEQSMRIGETLTKEMEDFKALNTNNFTSFSDKIIFPGTNVFTFKNIHLLTGQLDEQDAILLDIAYAQEHKV